MARIVVLGAGISGHTASAFLKKMLGKRHEVVVISPNQYYQWIPSNIWVGVGRMRESQVKFPLKKVYDRWGIDYRQAKAVSIHPDGDAAGNAPFVKIEYTGESRTGTVEDVPYDFLVNATGPKLAFESTEGLGPSGFTESVCSYHHATQAWKSLQEVFTRMEKGEKQKILIGTGHPRATCQGAAFEYTLNIASEIKRRKLESKAEITWLTNEYELGDFGMSGAFIRRNGYVVTTRMFSESILAEYGVKWIKRAGVQKVEAGLAHYETLDGEFLSQPFDFSMLIPPFTGVPMKAFDKEGTDITSRLFAANGFMLVDGDYSPKEFDQYAADDWPETYQNPLYPNIFAIGIAFAPPHPISRPMQSKNGTQIFPTPPRTGMPSGVMGKITAQNIAHWIKTGNPEIKHKASMAKMGAACIVSVGYGLLSGQAATMTVHPVVPDWRKYPDYGRELSYTVGEVGLAGHWMKLMLHYMFLHKAKGYPFWWLVPE